MATTIEIGKKLAELCRAGKNLEVVDTLYSPKIVSIEAAANPMFPARLEGIAAVKEKNQWWAKNREVHKQEVMGPWPHGDRFIVHFNYEVTAKAGPMAGKRMPLQEAAMYTVADGKIVQEEFFYDMSAPPTAKK